MSPRMRIWLGCPWKDHSRPGAQGRRESKVPYRHIYNAPMKLMQILDELSAELEGLSFSSPVAYVYNPLTYAREPIRKYLERYGGLGAENVFIGMNPGPWGMAQTGVPFGAVEPVRDWLGLEAEVGSPPTEHPKRPVQGFACKRAEVSGMRVWGWAQETFGTPEAFFKLFFIHNYCPLLFLADTGRNLTPDKLKAAERNAMLEPCNRALRRFIEALAPKRVIGVGVWAEARARETLGDMDLEISKMLHPSPASPAANRGWAEQASAQLREMGIEFDG